MQREMEWSVGKPGGEDDMLALQADTEAYVGHVKKARELSRRAVEVAQNAQLAEPAAIWEGIAALREAVYGNTAEARKGRKKSLNSPRAAVTPRSSPFWCWPASGKCAAPRPCWTIWRPANVSNTVVQSAWLPTIHAQAAMIEHKPAQALELLDAVKPYERGQLIGNLSYSCMIPVYFRAEAYLGANLGPQALAEFQKLRDNRGVVGHCWSGALAALGPRSCTGPVWRNKRRARLLPGILRSVERRRPRRPHPELPCSSPNSEEPMGFTYHLCCEPNSRSTKPTAPTHTAPAQQPWRLRRWGK